MSRTEAEIVVKLQEVLLKLSSSIDPEKKIESFVMIEDDTTLQKLHTYTHLHMKKSGNDLAWAQNVGLVGFIQRAVDLTVVSVPENASFVALAIKIFGNLLSTEETFEFFAEDKVLVDFCIIWPNLRSDPTLASASLDLLEGLLQHTSGLMWLLKNGVWEKLLLPSLRSPSIFVQRKGVKVIASLLLLVADTQHFEALVKDLLMVSNKFCELRQHVDRTLSEEICQSSLHVLFIFKELYLRTLGKTALYTKLNDIEDMKRHLLSMIEKQVPVTFITLVADVITLDAFHNFQEKMMEYGIIEQFLVDTLCADVIALVTLLFEAGHIESFYRSSVNVHKYWKVLITNVDDSKRACLKDEESLLHLVTCLQVTPITVFTKDFIKQNPYKKDYFVKWTDQIHCRINVKESVKAKAESVEDKMIAALGNDSTLAVRMAVVSISSLLGAVDSLRPMCGVTIFQGLVVMLCTATESETSFLRHQGELQRISVDTLRVLVDKFEIDWRKCFVSICLLYVLCEMMALQNISTQVKVLVLKAIRSCIAGFIPPVMSMLINSEEQHLNSVEQMGRVLAGCLADTEWEVRDSALEVILTCMTLAKHKYPYFVEWLLRFNLDSALLIALEDIEGYVRASAFSVLACVVPVDKVWVKLSDENIQHRSLAAVLWEGDTPVRKAAFSLVMALFSSGKFSEDDLKNLVINIVQRSAEDVDDEIRLSSLEFIHKHLEESLHKSGMVDGEFPAVTFSKGKITKLDKPEVQKRVMDIIIWICECGYLNCLLVCLNDPVSAVSEKAQQIFCFLHGLIDKYEIRIKTHSTFRRNTLEDMDVQFKASPKVKVEEITLNEKVDIAGETVRLTGDSQDIEEIDKTISDILHSSTLDNVSSIKRPPSDSWNNSWMVRKNVTITSDDVPLRNSSMPLEYLLQSLDNICRHRTTQVDTNAVNLLSLLDDILLDGCKVESPNADDQHLRDCY